MKEMIGSPAYGRSLEGSLLHGYRWKWFDFRGFELLGWVPQTIRLENSLVDELHYQLDQNLQFKGCWVLNPEFLRKFPDNYQQEIKASEGVWEAFEMVNQAIDFKILPAVATYFDRMDGYSLDDRVCLAVPLLWSTDDIIARNAFDCLMRSLSVHEISSNEALQRLILSLLGNPSLAKDVWNYLENEDYVAKEIWSVAFENFQLGILSPVEGEILTSLAVSIEANSMEWSSEVLPDLDRLVSLLAHPNPKIASSAWRKIRQIFRVQILLMGTSQQIRKKVEQQVFAMSMFQLEPFQHALLKEISAFLT